MRYLFVLVLLLLSACSTTPPQHGYKGSPRPLAETAMVVTDSEHSRKVLQGLDERLFVSAVDDFSLDNPYRMSGTRLPEAAYLVPGARKVKIEYGHGTRYITRCVTFDAKAGSTYIIRKELSGWDLTIWAEEQSTGKVVSSRSNESCGT